MPIYIHRSCTLARPSATYHEEDTLIDWNKRNPHHKELQSYVKYYTGADEISGPTFINREAAITTGLSEAAKLAAKLCDTVNGVSAEQLDDKIKAIFHLLFGTNWELYYPIIQKRAVYTSENSLNDIKATAKPVDKSYEELAKTRVWTKKQHEAKAAPSEHVLVDDLLRSVHPSHLDDLYKLSRNEDDALLIRCGWDDYQQGTGPSGPETQLAYQEGCVITLRRAAFEHARLHGSESDSLPADEGSATSVYTQSLGAMLINQISRHRNAGKTTDVRLNAKYCSKTFEELFAQGELATWKDGDSYVCVGMDACVELAKSPQAGDCIGNAETWKLLNVLVSLMLEYGTSDSGSEIGEATTEP